MALIREAASPGGGASAMGLEPPPATLLEKPLDYILADHFRQRTLCASLRCIAARRRSTRGDAATIAAYLTTELRRHHQDEDLDLYPALRRRVRPEDELGGILERLADDHRHTEAQAGAIVEVLSNSPAADTLPVDEKGASLMISFATTEHRHLAIENGIVLVIARKRLKPQDIDAIGRSMKARRGIFI